MRKAPGRVHILLVLSVALASVLVGWFPTLRLLLAAGMVVAILFLFPDHTLLVFLAAVVLGSILPPVTLPVLDEVGLTWSNGLAALAFASAFFRQIREGWRWQLSTGPCFMLLFVIWTAVTLLWAEDLRDGVVRVINWTVIAMAYVLLSNELRNTKTRVRSIRVLALVGWLLLIASFVMPGYTDTAGRLHVVTDNPNALASKLLLCTLGVVWTGDDSRSMSPLKILGIFAYLLFMGVAIIRGGSRGEIVSWLLMLLLLASRFRIQAAAFLPIVLVAWLIVLDMGLVDVLFNRFDDPTLGGRVELWQGSWMIFRENPIVGLGVGGTQEVLGEAVNAGRAFSPHNPFLLVLLDTGIVGLLLYSAALLVPISTFLLTVLKSARPPAMLDRSATWLLLSIFLPYTVAWVKSGGAQYNISIYYLLGLLLSFTDPGGMVGLRHSRIEKR